MVDKLQTREQMLLEQLHAENGGRLERVTPALHEGGRFLAWASVDLAAQCLSQAREQLDPEFSQFMTAVAARLAATPTQDARERVKVLEEALAEARRMSFAVASIPEGYIDGWADCVEHIRNATALGNKETDRHG